MVRMHLQTQRQYVLVGGGVQLRLQFFVYFETGLNLFFKKLINGSNKHRNVY